MNLSYIVDKFIGRKVFFNNNLYLCAKILASGLLIIVNENEYSIFGYNVFRSSREYLAESLVPDEELQGKKFHYVSHDNVILAVKKYPNTVLFKKLYPNGIVRGDFLEVDYV